MAKPTIEERIQNLDAAAHAHAVTLRALIERAFEGDIPGRTKMREDVCRAIESIYGGAHLSETAHRVVQRSIHEAEELFRIG